MQVLRKIVGKTKINRIRSQQIRESCGILHIKEWVERRREWEEYVTRMDAAAVAIIQPYVFAVLRTLYSREVN